MLTLELYDLCRVRDPFIGTPVRQYTALCRGNRPPDDRWGDAFPIGLRRADDGGVNRHDRYTTDCLLPERRSYFDTVIRSE